MQLEPPARPGERLTLRTGRCRAWRVPGRAGSHLPSRPGPTTAPPSLFPLPPYREWGWRSQRQSGRPACMRGAPAPAPAGVRSARGGQDWGAGAGGQPVSVEGQETTKTAKIKSTGRRDSAKREGWGWGGEATTKIKKVFQGNKTQEDGETGGKGERV